MSRFGEYLKDTRGELKHVTWPTRQQAVLFTIIVVVFSVVVAAFLGAFDLIFAKILAWFLGANY